MKTQKLSSDAISLYAALKDLANDLPGGSTTYLDLAESLAQIYGARSRAACEELERAGKIVLHETYVEVK